MNNIYLTGIMGCGKTTLGKHIAKHKNLAFFDTDCELERREQLNVKEIFSQYKESYFRDAESKALQELSLNNNAVIACGGGIILKEENIKLMQNTGKILFIYRDIKEIVKNINKTQRPLLQGEETLEEIYAKREHIYKLSCYEEINNCNLKDTVNYICSKYF